MAERHAEPRCGPPGASGPAADSLRAEGTDAVCFRADFSFRDGAPASVCGFCRRDRRRAVEEGFRALAAVEFGACGEGLLIDRRFARLLAQAALPERDALPAVAACVRQAGEDGPCGGVLGNLFSPPESPREDCAALTLPGGRRMRVLLRPGAGAAAFYCSPPQLEDGLAAGLAAEFPAAGALERLERQAAGWLWVLDYAPGSSVLTGRCGAGLRQIEAERGRSPCFYCIPSSPVSFSS